MSSTMRVMNHDLLKVENNNKIQRNAITIPSLPPTVKSDSSTLRPTLASSQSPAILSSSSVFSSTNISAAAAATNISAAGANGQQAGQQITIQKIPGLSVFLTKIYNIFSIREYSEKDWCCWGANGDTIVFKSVRQKYQTFVSSIRYIIITY